MNKSPGSSEVLRQRGWLAHQPEEFQRDVLATGTLHELASGERVYSIGDEPGGIYGIVSGGCLLSVGGIDGHQRLAHIARTGVWIGHGPVMTGRRRTIGVVAAEATVLLHVSLAAIERIKSRTPEAARWIGSISDFTQDYAIATAADLLIRQSDQRVAAVLLRVTDVLQGTQPQNAEGFAITQGQLAEMSAIGRDVCNGVLGRLETLGVVACHYGRIAILEPERLARLAETGKAV